MISDFALPSGCRILSASLRIFLSVVVIPGCVCVIMQGAQWSAVLE